MAEALTIRLRRTPGLRAFASPGFRVVCAAILCAGSVAGMLLHVVNTLANYRRGADINTLLATTRNFWSGVSTYTVPPASTISDRFLTGPTSEPYPPPTFVLLWPWSQMPDLAWRLTWVGLELAALAALVALVWVGIGRPTAAEGLTAVSLVLFLLPVRDTLFEGQFGILLALAAVGAALLWERGRNAGAGALLAAGIAIKLTPALMLLYLMQRRLFLVVAWTVGWFAAIVGATLAVGWLPRWLDYARLMVPIGRGTAFAGNQSVPGVILRLFRPDLSGQPIPPPPLPITVLSAGAEIAVLAWLVWVVGGGAAGLRVGTGAGATADDGAAVSGGDMPAARLERWTELSLVLLVLPLLQPFAWFHHWAAAAVAVLVVARLARLGRLRAWPAAGLGVAYAVSLVTYPVYQQVRNVVGADLAGHPLQMAESMVFFGIVALASVSLAAALRDLRQRRRGAGASDRVLRATP